MKNSRRDVLLGAGALVAVGASPLRATPVLTDDGYYRESWFIESFLELADDHAAARAKGKHFVVMWELKGCPYCHETHFVNFARPDISEFVQANFEILPLNVLGSRKVTDVDGEELPEKQLAAKYGVKFTPTILFFPDSLDGIKEVPAPKREVIRIPGYLRPDDFYDVFRFVAQRETGVKTFREFLRLRSS
ncbi:MAG: thioredoxin family protein [Xanthobacteraceae bacterium]